MHSLDSRYDVRAGVCEYISGIVRGRANISSQTGTRSTSDDNIFPNVDGVLQVNGMHVGNALSS